MVHVRRSSNGLRVQQMEVTMQKTVAFAIGATALVAVSALYPTTVSARKLRQTGEQSRYDQTGSRRAFDSYNQVGAPLDSDAERNLEDFGFTGIDRSRPGGMDPSLNPPS
jgi:hypothetical protein